MDDVEQIISMLLIKNQLYTRSVEDLEEYYLENRMMYLLFLISLSSLFSEDPYSVLMVDGVTDKISKLINKYRFERKEMKEEVLTELSNKSIVILNSLKTLDESELEDYKINQLKKRSMNIDTIEYLPNFMARDYAIIHFLENGGLDQISITEFLSGTYYLLNTYPIIYKENKEFISKSIEHIKNNTDSSNKNIEALGKKVIKRLKKNK